LVAGAGEPAQRDALIQSRFSLMRSFDAVFQPPAGIQLDSTVQTFSR
jgi:hypothetical protein